jgi:hypothetical protein
MLKWLPLLFIATNVYSQDLIEDMSKITHILSEEEVDHFVLKPGPKKEIDGTFFLGLTVPKVQNEDNTCEKKPLDLKPLKIRYEVLAITEEKPKDPKLQPQTTVIVAKFEEKENPLVTDVKNMIASQVTTGSKGGKMGTFHLRQHRDAGKTVVLYEGPGTHIDVQSTLKAEGTMNVDVNPIIGSDTTKALTPTIQMDVVNKLSINQEISKDVGVRTTVESLHTTGVRGLEALEGTKFNLSTFKAQTRVDAKLDRNVQSYTEVNYSTNTVDKEIRAVAGFDIKTSSNAQILVFTGYTNRSTNLGTYDRSQFGSAKEAGVEYKRKDGMTIFTRFKDGTGSRDRRIETGFKIPLGGK